MGEGTIPFAARSVVWTLACAVWLGHARAEEVTPQATLEYDRAIDAAVDEYERGNYAEAREHFREAHDLHPNARTLRGLGKVEFELRNYGEAVRLLGEALDSSERPLVEALRVEVEQLLQRASAYVGEVHVNVQPGTATVIVDGVTVASGPQAELNLLVGDHLLEFRALGRLPERRQISVRGREQLAVHVTLSAVEAERASAPLQAPRSDATPVYKEPWLWVGSAVAAAGVAVAVIFAARDRHEGASGGTSGLVLPSP
jgi:tetratricopeptide (TPR) repeat protein